MGEGWVVVWLYFVSSQLSSAIWQPLILSLTYLFFHLLLWCPPGREASPSDIVLLSLPALVPRAALLALVTGTSRGAQPKGWEGHHFAYVRRNRRRSIKSYCLIPLLGGAGGGLMPELQRLSLYHSNARIPPWLRRGRGGLTR